MSETKGVPTKKRGKKNPAHHRSGTKRAETKLVDDKQHADRLFELEQAMSRPIPQFERIRMFSQQWGVSSGTILAYEGQVRAHWKMTQENIDVATRRNELRSLAYSAIAMAADSNNSSTVLRGLDFIAKLDSVTIERVEVTGRDGAPLQGNTTVIQVLEGRSDKDLLYYGEHGRFPEEDA